MSDVEAVDIIADWLDEVETSAGVEWPFPTDALAAHVVSVLSEHGYSIVASEGGLAAEIYCQDCDVEMVALEGPEQLMTVKCPCCGEGWNVRPPAITPATEEDTNDWSAHCGNLQLPSSKPTSGA